MNPLVIKWESVAGEELILYPNVDIVANNSISLKTNLSIPYAQVHGFPDPQYLSESVYAVNKSGSLFRKFTLTLNNVVTAGTYSFVVTGQTVDNTLESQTLDVIIGTDGASSSKTTDLPYSKIYSLTPVSAMATAAYGSISLKPTMVGRTQSFVVDHYMTPTSVSYQVAPEGSGALKINVMTSNFPLPYKEQKYFIKQLLEDGDDYTFDAPGVLNMADEPFLQYFINFDTDHAAPVSIAVIQSGV